MPVHYFNLCTESNDVNGSILTLLHPLHSFYPNHQPHYTLKNVIKFLTSLYSRANLTNYETFKMLFLNGCYASEQEHQTFLEWTEDLPAEKAFVFAFMQRYSSRENIFTQNNSLYYCRINRYGTGTSFECDPHWIITSVTTKEDFLATIDTAYNHFNGQYLSHNRYSQQLVIHPENLPIANNFLKRYLKFIFGLPIVHFDGMHYPPAGVAELLSTYPVEWSYSIDPLEDSPDVKLRLKEIITAGSRRALYRVFNYSQNVLDLIPWPKVEPNEKDVVLYGVELELTSDYNVTQLIDAAKEPFFIAKSDGSITGTKPNAMELVTIPASFKYLKRAYAQWFHKLDYTKFDCTTTTNNGMHVHIGREHFEDTNHLRNFCWFYNNPAHEDFLLKVSERGSMESFKRWSSIYTFSRSVSRTQAFRRIYSELVTAGSHGSRYLATHLKGGQNGKTLEVRIFRGIVSYASIVKNLEFVDATFHFTKSLTSYRDLTLAGFLDWLKKTPSNKYPLLKKFLHGLNMDKVLLQVQLKDWLYGETDEDKILLKLKSAPFKVTNTHLSILNKGKKRTFFFNKDKGGELDVIYHNRGKLAALDKTFAERYLRNTTDSEAA